MWKDVPFDVLSNIFSFLSPDSLARAGSACRQWHACATAYPFTTSSSSSNSNSNSNPSWFMALPLRNLTLSLSCFLLNPVRTNWWHSLSLDFLPSPVRPVGSVGGLILLRTTNSTTLRLLVCNPFTRQYKHLPLLNIPRTNPAVGVVALRSATAAPFPCFRVYVAGGMSAGATYEPTLEMYDSGRDAWKVVGNLPMEYAVRMTVWTPNESVHSDGLLYWITSARAYSLMGYEIGSDTWREMRVPMADKLEFAALVWRKGRLTLVGGTSGGDACVWELSEGDNWEMVDKVPMEMGMKFVGEKESWAATKCVGSDNGHGAVYLYRDFGSGMLVWKEIGENGKWEWFWIDKYGASVGGKQVPNLQIKGLLIQPNLAPSCFF